MSKQMIQPLLTNLRSSWQRVVGFFFTNAVNYLLRFVPRSYLQITNKFGYADGAGAQIQRILSLIAFSRKYNLEFVLTPIQFVEVQPIDFLVNEEELQNNVIELNRWLVAEFGVETIQQSSRLIEIDSRQGLCKEMATIIFKRSLRSYDEKISFRMLDAYFETKNFPKTWSLLQENKPNLNNASKSIRYAHIHFRLSTFSEKSDRNIPMSYYQLIMQGLVEEAARDRFQLHFIIHTDFNGINVDRDFFRAHAVPQSLEYWVKLGLLTDDFEIDEMLLAAARRSLNDLLSDFRDVHFFDEKSWVSQWIAMSKADYLVTSKSSFSLIGGVLNESGTIYVPESWNLALPGWRPIR